MTPTWSLVALSVPPFAVTDLMVTEESVGATTVHTVLAVVAQAVFTPAAHVEAAAHGEHGVFPSTYPFPEEDQVELAAQGVAGQVSEAQSLWPRVLKVNAVFDFQASAIRRLLHEVREVAW